MFVKIKEHRKRIGLTQKQIAEILGVRQNTVCLWEQGKREPSIVKLKKMAFLFGITVDELIVEE